LTSDNQGVVADGGKLGDFANQILSHPAVLCQTNVQEPFIQMSDWAERK
jgi:hypothetical protein